MRFTAAVLAAIVLSACGGHAQRSRVAAHDDLSAVQALVTQLPGSSSTAPTRGITVTGTITNGGGKSLKCNAIAFLIVDAHGNAVSPISQYCDVPAIAPKDSGYFSATFSTRETENLQLRFEHPDGTYEVHDLIVPPA